jgi:dTMP kinase
LTDRAGGIRFITFEGIDGSGKSTQARLLADHLRAAGREVVLTREPGGSEGAEAIRRLLVEGDPGRWSAETELLLFTAARRDHLERTIRPALDRGATVICDRFVDSTRVYQGTTRGDLAETVDRLHAMIIKLMPDLTFVIDTEPEQALERTAARAGTEARFEGFGLDFQRRLREGFIALTRAEPMRCRLVAGTGEVEVVARRVQAQFEAANA